jgi:hypothetical protein
MKNIGLGSPNPGGRFLVAFRLGVGFQVESGWVSIRMIPGIAVIISGAASPAVLKLRFEVWNFVLVFKIWDLIFCL